MLDFLNEVLLIEDLEPDAYQMGISGKSGAKVKAPDGGKAGIKGDFNALHPRYPKGHPQGGKFMPKGSKDQIKAIAKNTGQSVEKVAAAVGGKAPTEKVKGRVSNKETMRRNLANQEDSPIADKPKRGRVSGKELMRRNQEFDTTMSSASKAPANKGKLSKFSGSAGAVGKAQKVLKNKESTPEQRAKAKASIKKAADQGRDVYGSIKESKGKEKKRATARMNRFVKLSDEQDKKVAKAAKAGKVKAPVPTGSMTQGVSKATQKRKKLQGKLDKMNKRSMDIRMKEGKSEAYYKNSEKSDKYAAILENGSTSSTSSPAAAQKAIAKSIARNKAKTDSTAKAARKESAYKNSPKGKAEAKVRAEKVKRNIISSEIARKPEYNWLGSMGSAPKSIAKSIARNAKKKAKR